MSSSEKVTHMKKTGIIKAVCTGALAAVCCFGLAACGGASSSSSETSAPDVHDTTGGVAATVNGVEIGEDAITAYIEDFRASSGLTDEASWAQWMVDGDYTPATVREDVINYYVQQEVIRLAAADQGITISQEEIDEQVAAMRAYYDSDEDWEQALAYMGINEAQYREMLELSFLQQGLLEAVGSEGEIDEEELLMYAQIYGTAYNGAKKSSHILFAADDEATAQQVLDKINSGAISFEDAAAQYSMDSSAADGGNVGWDAMSTFVTEYQDALDQLSEGEVSGLVVSQYGIHIIKCTEVYNAPEEITSIDDIPADFADAIRATLADSSKQTAYSEWLNEYQTNCDIVINEMPEGLPYDVDTTGYVSSYDDSTTFNLEEGTVEDGAAEGEATESEDAAASQPGEVSAS